MSRLEQTLLSIAAVFAAVAALCVLPSERARAQEETATAPCWTGPASTKMASYCAFKLTQAVLQ